MSGTGKPDRVTMTELKRTYRALTHEWTSQPELAERAGLSVRRLQAAVHQLVLTGAPILSGSAGNRFTTSAAQLQEAADSLHHRALEILAREAGLRRTAAKLAAEASGRPTQVALPLDAGPAPA